MTTRRTMLGALAGATLLPVAAFAQASTPSAWRASAMKRNGGAMPAWPISSR